MKRKLARYLGNLPPDDMARIGRLRSRLQAESSVETIRRLTVTMETLLEHQENGGDIVLCKKGVADKVVWFL